MYLQHFGLREAPFRLTPDTTFYFPGSSHQEALNVLRLALSDGEGFIKITGEVGLGKTLLCRTLLASLDPHFCSAWIPNPDQSPASMRAALARELGIELPYNQEQDRVMRLITDRLLALAAVDRRPVLVIDEAQALPTATLEAVRLLTNIETEHRKLLQVVLFGQPELDRRLTQPSLRQLRQRISFSHHLQPLDAMAVSHYVRHRLRVAGHVDGDLFSARALRKLATASRGVPRLVNVLAHKALLAGWGRGRGRVGRAELARAVADTEDVARSRRPALLWLSTFAAILIAASLGWWRGWPG